MTKEELLKAKISCPETGIHICHTLCDICSPGNHCGIDAYVKDGKVIKVEGTKSHPLNKGLLCTKGCSNRQYLYREDRLHTPLLRTGKRGEGTFRAISWGEAYRMIADKLLQYKANYGAQSVMFFSGYSKWYRFMLARLAYSFGTPNYGTESSSCFKSGLMAWQTAAGGPARPDMGHTRLFLGWAANPYFTGYLAAKRYEALKQKGVKFIIIDTMYTKTAARYADLFLQPLPGTDGALALAIANVLIEHGWIDKPYIDKYVHGFKEYAEYCRNFGKDNIETLTGVAYEKVYQAAEMIHEAGRICVKESSAPLAHHINGMQNYRAIMALTAITGSYDRTGGQMPVEFTFMEQASGYSTWEEKFMQETRRDPMAKPVGGDRFPLWYELEGRGEAQAMDLYRQLNTGSPYPLKALLAFGINFRMFPESTKLAETLAEKLDFFVDVDLFMTDAAKYADLVLPACTSLEREDFRSYPGGYAFYTKPAIKPLYESQPDSAIIQSLAEYMNLDDPLLRKGYRACIEYLLTPVSVTVDELQAAETPLKVPEWKPFKEMEALTHGLSTPTGRFELKSELIATHPEWGLDALPTYRAPWENADRTKYPLILTEGGRLPNALHSRLHDMKWLRTLRPRAMADLHPETAAQYDIRQGDFMEIGTPIGRITVYANLTRHMNVGQVSLYHGYRESNYSDLVSNERLDPYSGFPAYRSNFCYIKKVEAKLTEHE